MPKIVSELWNIGSLKHMHYPLFWPRIPSFSQKQFHFFIDNVIKEDLQNQSWKFHCPMSTVTMETGSMNMPCFHTFPDVRYFRHGYHGNEAEILRMHSNFIPMTSNKTYIPNIFKICDMPWPSVLQFVWFFTDNPY